MDRRLSSGKRRGALVVLALAAAAVCSVRAESLLLEGFEPSSRTELRWLAWATEPRAQREALIRSLRERQTAGDFETALAVERPPGLRDDLVDVIAHYFFPRTAIDWLEPGVDLAAAGEASQSHAGGRLAGRWSDGVWPDGVQWTIGVLLTVLIGFCCLKSPRRFSDLAAAWAAGSSVWLCLGGAVASLGVPLGRPTTLALWTVALLAASWRLPRGAWIRPEARSRSGSDLALGLLGLCAVAWWLVAWKVALAPLWSWDHWAIWGYKSRLLLESGALPILGDRSIAAPQYPLGLPASWNTVAGGAALEAWQVKSLHLMAITTTGVLAGQLARKLGASTVGGLFAALATWMLPLAWSTEGVGLAEAWLAQTTLLALWSMIPDEDDQRASPLLTVSSLVALAFVKDEGSTLALLLLAVFLIVRSEARWRWAAASLLGLGLARGLAPEGGTPFAAGDWQARLAERLGEPLAVLRPTAEELLRFEVFGLWLVAPLLLLVALTAWIRGRRQGLWCSLLLGVACTQLLAYVAIYFVTYLEPRAHIVSSLARIASALEPLVVVAVVVLLGGDRGRAGERSLPG